MVIEKNKEINKLGFCYYNFLYFLISIYEFKFLYYVRKLFKILFNLLIFSIIG